MKYRPSHSIPLHKIQYLAARISGIMHPRYNIWIDSNRSHLKVLFFKFKNFFFFSLNGESNGSVEMILQIRCREVLVDKYFKWKFFLNQTRVSKWAWFMKKHQFRVKINKEVHSITNYLPGGQSYDYLFCNRIYSMDAITFVNKSLIRFQLNLF